MLHTLVKLTSRQQKRPGRGVGSGKGGHTSGRGGKGHTARTGGKTPLWFEGGQLPLIRRLPFLRGKLRFGSLEENVQVVSLSRLMKFSGDVTPETLEAAGIIKNAHWQVRLVGKATLSGIKEVRGVAMTQGAKESLEQAGGTLV